MTADLIIAGRRIRLRSEEGITLRPDERFSAFMAPARKEAGAGEELSGEVGPELTVDVFPGRAEIPSDAKKVFDARLMEETPDGLRDTGEPFWEIFTRGGVTFARVYLKDPLSNPVLVMPQGEMTWQIFADGQGPEVNPLPYPLDGLLLWFLSSSMGDIMIHGSGVICGGRGWIFTGRSGSGKTTLAGIFDRAGDWVVHDDRLILRKEEGRWVMHSTPVYRNDEPRSAPVDHLWGISHGRSNVSAPVTGAEAVAMVLANCVQQNREREAATRLAAAVEELVSSVRVSRLSFMPDGQIREYLIARKSDNAVTGSGAASAMLAEGKPVIITAGGYSMWPAIRPGDRLVINPLNPQIPLAKGMVVALRRDGGFVVHRITEYRRGKFINLIRTRGDTTLIYDTWIPSGDVAGLVKKMAEDGKTIMISPQRMPCYIGSLAVAMIKIWNAVRRRF